MTCNTFLICSLQQKKYSLSLFWFHRMEQMNENHTKTLLNDTFKHFIKLKIQFLNTLQENVTFLNYVCMKMHVFNWVISKFIDPSEILYHQYVSQCLRDKMFVYKLWRGQHEMTVSITSFYQERFKVRVVIRL